MEGTDRKAIVSRLNKLRAAAVKIEETVTTRNRAQSANGLGLRKASQNGAPLAEEEPETRPRGKSINFVPEVKVTVPVQKSDPETSKKIDPEWTHGELVKWVEKQNWNGRKNNRNHLKKTAQHYINAKALIELCEEGPAALKKAGFTKKPAKMIKYILERCRRRLASHESRPIHTLAKLIQ